MITDMNARVAMAQKLSIPQLQQAIKNGTIPAYVGVPLLQDKMRQQQQMQMAAAQQQQGQQGQQQQRPIADEVMNQAYEMSGGVDQLPSNLPIQNEEDEENYAGGGIIAFDNGGPVDLSKIPTNELTEDQFNALSPKEQERRIKEKESAFSGYGTGWLNTLPTVPAALGAVVTTPFLAAARTVLPESVNQRIPTVGDLYGERGVGGILERAVDKASEARYQNAEAEVRGGFRTHDPVAEGASPGAQEPKFVGGTTGGGAYVGYRKQRTPGSGTPQAQPPALPQQDTSRLAFDYEEPTVLPTTVVRGDSTPETASPNIDSQYIAQDMQEGNRGITAAPGARLAPSGTPGAPPPSTTSSGAVSPDVARQISATNPGAPATLKDAERQAASGSPQASAALTMLDRYVAMMEKSGDDVGRQKKEALYMALIQGGLGMMGGTSPNAFANISAGLLPATQAYQQAIAGIRKDDRARLEKLLSAGLKKEEFLLKAKEIGINQQKADNWYEVMRERNAAMAARGGGGDDNKKNTAYNLATNAYQQAVGKTDALIAKIKQDNSMYLDYTGKDPNILKKKNRVLSDIAEQNSKKDNLYTQYRGYVTDRLGIEVPDFSGAAPKSNAPAVGTVQQGYRFKGGDPKDPKSWEKV